jgi:hypothetical protein
LAPCGACGRGCHLAETPAKKVSQTDPRARWTAAPGGPAYYAYSTNYLVDTEAGIIVDVEATTALRNQEVWSTPAMIERVQARFNLKVQKLIGDTAYGTAEFLSWMVEEADIEPHVPVWDRGDAKPDRFGRSDYHYDAETDSYTCPGGKLLMRSRRNYSKPRNPVCKDEFSRHLGTKRDCPVFTGPLQCLPLELGTVSFVTSSPGHGTPPDPYSRSLQVVH